jgi:hypothetical protein
VKGELRLVLPNPHQGEIGRELLARILRQAGMTRTEWEKLWKAARKRLTYFSS